MRPEDFVEHSPGEIEMVGGIFTEPQAVGATGRSQPAVNKWVRQLWDDGVLRETTGQQRNRRYEATDVLDIVEPY